jgi:hypothetical protein
MKPKSDRPQGPVGVRGGPVVPRKSDLRPVFHLAYCTIFRGFRRRMFRNGHDPTRLCGMRHIKGVDYAHLHAPQPQTFAACGTRATCQVLSKNHPSGIISRMSQKSALGSPWSCHLDGFKDNDERMTSHRSCM